ncbi:unnamed protein product [Chironomus riparius]|uniref:Uncharacterized protein n=1 Tax=Chironomus riparius TaxID=315576 RepID=A0A9N9RM95_9DIPT|nr:unnamed protein product [Chironomus riparius]
MRFFIFIILSIAAIANSSNLDADFASVISKIQTINHKTAKPEEMDTVPLDIVLFLPYFDRDCVVQKLGLKPVNSNQIYNIPKLNDFQNASTKNKKILIAVENAARLCTRNSKDNEDAGLFQMIQLRGFLTELVFPETKLNPDKAVECFKWALSKVKPNSPVLDGFKIKSMKYTVDQCKVATSIQKYSKIVDDRTQKLNIQSCDQETFGQAKTSATTIMELFLFLKLFSAQVAQHQDEVTGSAMNSEANLLETELSCILRDLKNE